MTGNTAKSAVEDRRPPEQYYSAEFSISGLGTAYQFRIRNTASTPMCVLVREDSNILPWLKVGNTLNVKYYGADGDYAPQCLETEIRKVTRDEQGRFRGHYLVGLEILAGRKEPPLAREA